MPDVIDMILPEVYLVMYIMVPRLKQLIHAETKPAQNQTIVLDKLSQIPYNLAQTYDFMFWGIKTSQLETINTVLTHTNCLNTISCKL